MTTVSTLRPGFLVSLKSSIRGNTQYVRQTIEEQKMDKGSKLRWETVRTITDQKEHDEAVKARTAARVAVYGVCSPSAFGLLCPDNKAEQLQEAIDKATKIAADFNAKAKYSHLGVYVMRGRIAQDDVSAIRAINSEVRDLLKDMKDGLKNLDVKAVRDAANKARAVGKMLTPEAEERVKSAIEVARGEARKIVKAGEAVAVELDKEAMKKLEQSRTSFLDLGEAKAVKVKGGGARAVDLEPVKPVVAKKKTKQPELELGA